MCKHAENLLGERVDGLVQILFYYKKKNHHINLFKTDHTSFTTLYIFFLSALLIADIICLVIGDDECLSVIDYQ